MSKIRRPQTVEKRRRERDKQEKRMAKLAARLARSAARREASRQGGDTGHADEAAGPGVATPEHAEEKP